ncbi:hypothetical protein GW796_00375 [archaeon]|nr:hypothetical protein [archaeon]
MNSNISLDSAKITLIVSKFLYSNLSFKFLLKLLNLLSLEQISELDLFNTSINSFSSLSSLTIDLVFLSSLKYFSVSIVLFVCSIFPIVVLGLGIVLYKVDCNESVKSFAISLFNISVAVVSFGK